MIRALPAAAVVALVTALLLGPAIPAGSVQLSPIATAARTETAATAPPLIVLMDTSGSMDETVPTSEGSGTVKKLEAAKTALQEPIRNQPPGSRLGIRTYPGGTIVNGCETGSWLVDIDSGTAPAGVFDEIDALTADGGTPTGPALESVIADLNGRGIRSANIVVVSDGLYTCGTDPCEVAKGLAGTGFSVTIQTVGFAISADGAENLKCIAEATGGKYFDAGDSGELTEVITKLTSPVFNLTLKSDSSPVAGSDTTITVTVQNSSSYDARTVGVRLAFTTGKQLPLVPRVVPALIEIGTLPAGESATRSWTFVAGRPEIPGTAIYSVSASSLGTLPVQVTGTFTTTVEGSSAEDTGPILKDLIGSGQSLVIMGDSYSSGQGAYSYLPPTRDVGEACHRSPETYLARPFTEAKVQVEIIACSGAVSGDFQIPQGLTERGTFLAASQLSQLRALKSIPGAVVMTLGGNDIGFADIVVKCVKPGSYCASPDYKSETLAKIPKIENNLVASYEGAWRVLNRPANVDARKGAFAPLVVLAYPLAVHAEKFQACPLGVIGLTGVVGVGGFDVEETKFANRLVTTLNDTVEKSVQKARDDGIEIYYVDATEQAAREGHTACAGPTDRWINNIDLSSVPVKAESMHPNTEGYKAMTSIIIPWSQKLTLKGSTDAAKQGTKLKNEVLDYYLNPRFKPTKPDFFTIGTVTPVRPGSAAQLDVPNMGSAPVSVILHSSPRLLTTLVPEDDGSISASVAIPADTPVGVHELVLTGWDEDGNKITKTATIVVKRMTPIWVWAIGIAGGLLLLGAIVLALVHRRRRT